MSSEPRISLSGVGKMYPEFSHPVKHLMHLLPGGGRWVRPVKYHHALSEVSLEVCPGECLGIVGRNGAGKSTLLQLVAGIMSPSSGELVVRGRVAALLELGAGFNPRFTGRENIMLNGVLLGLSHAEIVAHIDEIIEFSELGEKVDHPVSTYSSGMFVRLAFAVATAVMPDVLIIDEALSVGDGAFAKKSFDRIMAMKDRGVTILFCSHATYHVDTVCDRAVWLDHGVIRSIGPTADTLDAYNQFLVQSKRQADFNEAAGVAETCVGKLIRLQLLLANKPLTSIDGVVPVKSGETGLSIQIQGFLSFDLLSPNIGVVFNDASGHNVTSCGTHVDDVSIDRGADGHFHLECKFPELPLLRGVYTIHVFLLCERGIHIYDTRQVATLKITQDDPSLGVFRIPHVWCVQ
jgi:lipopolysaccharide transport system ATP-binding protein